MSAALNDPRATHYAVLGVSPGDVAEDGVLREARRALMLQVHPDRNADGTAHDLAARVNAAYSVLSNDAARRLYDAQLRTTHAVCGPCEGAGFRFVQRGFKGASRKLKCLGCAGEGWLRK